VISEIARGFVAKLAITTPPGETGWPSEIRDVALKVVPPPSEKTMPITAPATRPAAGSHQSAVSALRQRARSISRSASRSAFIGW
jgi:hypothetical protein